MNKILKEYYEITLAKHGPTAKGMDWPNEKDLEKRFEVMLRLMRNDFDCSVLDIGCGMGLLLEALPGRTEYFGVDISPSMVKAAKKRWEDFLVYFETRNILKKPLKDNSYDYCIMNGILTVKASNTQEQMWDFAKKMIKAAFKTARIGIAFNVMSKQVDYERADLFHVGFDEMAEFLTKEVSRHFVFRNDYGLYEFTCYVYKEAQ